MGEQMIKKIKKIIKVNPIKPIKSRKLENVGKVESSNVFGFRFKLIMAFLVPAVLIVVVGLVSYSRSKATIIKNYEETTQGNMDNSAMYFNLLMTDIESKSTQIANNENLVFYYARYGSYSIAEANTFFTDAKNAMASIVHSSDGIYNAYAFGKEGVPISTLSKEPAADIYESFIESEDAKRWGEMAVSSSGRKAAWLGYHDTIDQATTASPEYYAASYIRTFSRGEGYIVIDLMKNEVEEVLANSISNDGALSIFITNDGRQTVAGAGGVSSEQINNMTNISEEEYYKNILRSEEESGFGYIDFMGESSLFVFSKIGNTGAVVCSIIPESDIYSSLGTIRTTILIMVLIACAIAVTIGLLSTNDISKVINKFSSSFRQVAEGNLKLRINSNRKDEFGDLARDMDIMMETVQDLVGEMADFSYGVSAAAVNVSKASSEILDAVNDVYDITKVMGLGVNDQRVDIENSYSQMTGFAQQINEAYKDTKQVDDLADTTQNTVRNGQKIVNDLMTQVTSTSEITGVIIDDIKELQEHSNNIGIVVEAINEIAATTELLALNASIEAARAGSSGRGFAVIASEIRKLAEQSLNSVKEIEDMIISIQDMTKRTSLSADKAKNMLGTQAESLNNTVELFGDVDIHMADLMEKINQIMNNMQVIMVSKDNILDLIRNIAAVSQETVASSEDVESTVARQVTSVETLDAQSKDLNEKIEKLEQAIAKFTI